MAKRIIWLWILIVIIVVNSGGCKKPESKKPAMQTETEITSEAIKTVTIDGYDSESKDTIQNINLWKNYDKRPAEGIAGIVRHGEKVKMIERKGNGVLIETSNGVRGWVTYYFIKELK